MMGHDGNWIDIHGDFGRNVGVNLAKGRSNKSTETFSQHKFAGMAWDQWWSNFKLWCINDWFSFEPSRTQLPIGLLEGLAGHYLKDTTIPINHVLVGRCSGWKGQGFCNISVFYSMHVFICAGTFVCIKQIDAHTHSYHMHLEHVYIYILYYMFIYLYLHTYTYIYIHIYIYTHVSCRHYAFAFCILDKIIHDFVCIKPIIIDSGLLVKQHFVACHPLPPCRPVSVEPHWHFWHLRHSVNLWHGLAILIGGQ